VTLHGLSIRFSLVVLIAGAGVSPRIALAQSRWERQVHDHLQRALNAVRARDAGTPIVSRSGALNGEESESFVVTLVGGVPYAILGVCDDDCSRLQLVLATLANNELALDRNSENFPILQFTPNETRQYRIRVGMETCRMNPCWYGVGITPSGQRPPKRP
jgi:hypothetical protein